MYYSIFMNNVRAITNTDIILIKLNVEAGRSVQEIAATTGIQESVIEKAVTDYGLAQVANKVSTEDLVSQEIRKCNELLPVYTQLELLMLAKAKDYLESLEISDEAFGVKYASMAKALKDVRATAPPQLVNAQSQTQNTGIQVQIINRFGDEESGRADNNSIQLRAEGIPDTSV